jgi:curved DNA-binding protein CbpA
MLYYEILGVKHDASLDEIKKAYRKCTQMYHTEKGSFYADNRLEQYRKQHSDLFPLLYEAYSVLSDPKQRALYDVKILTLLIL